MTRRWKWAIVPMIAVASLWGCSNDNSTAKTPVTPTQTAFEVAATAGAAYINRVDCPGVLDAQNLYDHLSEYTVIDIRSQATYDAGHIPGAYHSTLGTLIADLPTFPTGKPYVVTCYTGQSAGYAKYAMEMLGYGDVQSLKFGMASWNSTLATSWDGGCADALPVAETTDNNASLTNHSYPNLTGNASTIVQTRVAQILTDNFQSLAYTDIAANIGDYFVINYFGEADYSGTGTTGVPGHIPGAYQFTPGSSLAMNQMLKKIPTDKDVVVYCWTGQTSSQVVAYLNMLGYHAYSLKFGANNLFHSSLTASKWSDATKHDFPLEVTAP